VRFLDSIQVEQVKHVGKRKQILVSFVETVHIIHVFAYKNNVLPQLLVANVQCMIRISGVLHQITQFVILPIFYSTQYVNALKRRMRKASYHDIRFLFHMSTSLLYNSDL